MTLGGRDLFFRGGVYLRRRRKKNPRRLVVLKTLAKLTFDVAALATATSFATSPSHASGNALGAR
jgi:hypothetical protein